MALDNVTRGNSARCDLGKIFHSDRNSFSDLRCYHENGIHSILQPSEGQPDSGAETQTKPRSTSICAPLVGQFN